MKPTEEEITLASQKAALELKKLALEVAEAEKKQSIKWYKSQSFLKAIAAVVLGLPILVFYVNTMIVPKYEFEKAKFDLGIAEKEKELVALEKNNIISEFNQKINDLQSKRDLAELGSEVSQSKQQLVLKEAEYRAREGKYNQEKAILDEQIKAATDWILREENQVTVSIQLDDLLDKVHAAVNFSGTYEQKAQLEFFEKSIPYFARFEKESLPLISDVEIRNEFFYFKAAVNDYIVSLKAGDVVEAQKKRTYSIWKYVYLSHLLGQYRNEESIKITKQLRDALLQIEKKGKKTPNL